MKPIQIICLCAVAFSFSRMTAQPREHWQNPLLHSGVSRPQLPMVAGMFVGQKGSVGDPRLKRRWEGSRDDAAKGSAQSSMQEDPSPTWARHYINPTERSNSIFECVVVDKQGNIYAGGYTEESFPRKRVALLAKYDNKGARQWIVHEFSSYSGIEKLGIDSGGNVYAVCEPNIIKYNKEGVKLWSIDSVWAPLMAVDPEGNLCVAANECTDANCNGAEIVTTKYNTDGVFQWSKQLSMAPGAFHAPYGFCVDSSGHILLTGAFWTQGQSTPTALTVKYRNDGTEEWRATYPGAYGIDVASGGSGFTVVSAYFDPPNSDNHRHFTIMYDPGGTRRWVSETSGSYGPIAPDDSGNVIAAINVNSSTWNIVKYDHQGLLKWTRTIARPGGDYGPYGLTVDKQGNSFVAGCTDKEMTIVSLDAKGMTRYALSYPECGMATNGGGPVLAISPPTDSSGNIYVVGGADGAFGSFHKGLLVSLSSIGIQQWLATYEGPKVPMDTPAGIGLDSAGNVYVCGTGPWGDAFIGHFVLKYDANGNFLWKHPGDSTSLNGERPPMQVARDGSVFVLHGTSEGTSQSLSLTALNSSGTCQWSRLSITPGTTFWRQKQVLLLDHAENPFVVGCTKGPWDGLDGTMVIAAYAGNGTPQWDARVPGRTPLSAALTSTGELSVLTIASSWYGTGIDSPSVYRFDNSGHIRWIVPLETTGFRALGLSAGDSGSVYVSGNVYIPSTRSFLRTLKLDELGARRWVKDYDEGGSFDEQPSDIVSDRNGNVIVAGGKTMVSYDAAGNQRWVWKAPPGGFYLPTIDGKGDIFVLLGGSGIMKYSNDGTVLWTGSYSDPEYGLGFGGAALAPDGHDRIYITGGSATSWGKLGGVASSIITTLRFDLPLAAVSEIAASNPVEFSLSQNYPNPFNPSTTIRYGLPHKTAVQLAVFNTLGQQIALLQNGEQDAGYHEMKFDAANLSSGVYFYRLQAGSFVQSKKLMLLK